MFKLLLSIFLFSSAVVNGQQLLFENYSSGEGLSQNSGNAIAQDADGFMWFGTQDGLNRYDGKRFKIFLPHAYEGRKMPCNNITSLYYDNYSNHLWIGTFRGLCLYSLRGDSMATTAEMFPYAAELNKVMVKNIVSFTENEYWIITYNKGLLYINSKKKSVLSFFTQPDQRYQVNSLAMHKGKIIVSLAYQLYQMNVSSSGFQPVPLLQAFHFPEIKEIVSYKNALWVGTLNGGCFYIENDMTKISDIHRFQKMEGGVSCFSEDANGDLWIGTNGKGIIKYNPVSNSIVTAIHNDFDPRSPGKDFVLSLFKDRQGIVWCGLSGGGFAKHDPLKHQFTTLQHETFKAGSLPDNMVFDIFKTRDDAYFIGTQNHGLCEWDRTTNTFTQYPFASGTGISANTIHDIAEGDNNNLWIASWDGLAEFQRRTKKIVYHSDESLPFTLKLCTVVKLRNADSLFLMGQNGAGFYSIKEKKWQPCPESRSNTGPYVGRYIYQDENDILWICTVGEGLIRYDYRRRDFKVVEAVKKKSITARHIFQEGSYLLVATDDGIIIYDFKKDKFIKQVFPGAADASGVCYAIQKDNQGFFWVSTNLGLLKMNAKNYSVEKDYNEGNGLRFLEYNTACLSSAGDGTLIFGGVNGITLFNPQLLKENRYSPTPLITDIMINDKPWPAWNEKKSTNKLSLGYKQNFITVQFAVNNFSNEKNNRFSYRLKGLNDNWSAASTASSANFTSLPTGHYIFELRSANSDGQWSKDITTLTFSISPPWWATWWFRTMALLFLAAIIYFFIRRRIQTIRRDAALKQQLAQMEIKGLHAQMNPHFIFNCLNSIKEMILDDKKQQASRYLSKFAQLIRTNLEQSRQTFITVRQCVDHLQQYIEMEKLRFEDFEYRIEVDEALDAEEIKIAPMLLQPLVENAIWHGLRSKENDRKLTIRFLKNNQQVVCEVEDNGVGIRHSINHKPGSLPTHRSVGIANIQERLALLNEKYNMDCALKIKDKTELTDHNSTGTVAQLTV